MSFVGISDISFYIPPLTIHTEEIIRHRIAQKPELSRRLQRALHVTGQISLHFPYSWQDAVTLGAQSIHSLLQQNPSYNLDHLRYLMTGTETAVDMSKPIAAYIEGLLQRSGIKIPHTLSTFQVQHACAGGTIGLLAVCSLLQAQDQKRFGIVTCTDIARYAAYSTAELSQGAGAVSLLVEPNPQLLSLDIARTGNYSEDVDDFFRPVGSTIAVVKGGYSIECYTNAVENAFLDYCKQIQKEPSGVLRNTDFLVFHVPFPKMVYTGTYRLFKKFLGLSYSAMMEDLVQRGVPSMTDAAAKIGNIYTGSIYLALRYLLIDRYQTLGQDIVGKKILLFSYGSGNTITVFQATVLHSAPRIIQQWSKQNQPVCIPAHHDEYTIWMNQNSFIPPRNIPSGMYYLKNIRDDGYREYEFTK